MQVIAAAQDLLEALMPRVGTIAVVNREDDAEDDKDSDAAHTPSEGDRSSLAGYAVQLVLSCIEARLREHNGGGAEASSGAAGKTPGRKSRLVRILRPELAVRAVQEAPDSAVRNAALSLVSVLAAVMPEAVLKHVLEVGGTSRGVLIVHLLINHYIFSYAGAGSFARWPMIDTKAFTVNDISMIPKLIMV